VTRVRAAGALMLAAIAVAAVAAPMLTPHSPAQYFEGFEQAPPMLPHIVRDGRLTRPYVHPVTLVNRLERRYAPDPEHPLAIQWLVNGSLASVDESRGPWFPLGSDALGRDVFARVLYGTRLSLGVACAATLGALVLGLLVGGTAGFVGGRVETVLMALADFVLVLPAIYMVLAIRSALPAELTVSQVFLSLTVVLTLVGWPITARGVRAIVSSERGKEYAEAAYAMGARPLRILLRHLLPAATSFVAVTATMMVPAFVLTEGTLALVGMGFRVPTASWGVMLREAWQGSAFTDAPWLMAPAGAIVVTVLALQLLTSGSPAEGRQAGTFQ
jgi:peptide/nickel transport system permease protein